MSGFKGYRRPEVITDEALNSFLDRSGLSNPNTELYIYWTGGEYKRRLGSLRSQALYALSVKGKPVRVGDWLREAARCKDADNQIGFDPATVRSGLFLHQIAKTGCVYLALERRPDGSFVAERDVPNPDPRAFSGPLRKGDVVIAAADAQNAVAEVEAQGAAVVEKAETRRIAAPVTAEARRRGKRG